MGDILVQRVGGMVADPRLWPSAVSRGILAELPASLSLNTTYALGPVQGRRGQRQIYAPRQTVFDEAVPLEFNATATTGANGPVALTGRHSPRQGMEYIITASYLFNTLVPGTAVSAVVISVHADLQHIVSQAFRVRPQETTESLLSTAPLHGQSFGNSYFITGPRLEGSTNPIGFIRVRFQRSGVTIAESTLFDRSQVPFGPGDDDAPYSPRVPNGNAMAVFNGRLVIAFGKRLMYLNTGDGQGVPSKNYIDFPGEGDITALGPGDRYLVVAKENGASILHGGLTSVSDTSVDVWDGHPGCVSHRGLITTAEGQYTIARDGVYLTRPNTAAVRLTDALTPFLFGGRVQSRSVDYSKLTPVRESFRNAPAAYLPQRRELYIALSTGRSANIGAVHPQQPAVRDLWLVMYLPVGAPPECSIWTARGTAYQKTAESMLGYMDADGFETLLHGSHAGSVYLNHIGDTDQLDNNSASDPGQVTQGFDCSLVLAPVPVPNMGRTRINTVEVGFAESRVNGTATGTGSFVMKLRTTAGIGDGAYNGSVRSSNIAGRSAGPRHGTALPFTLSTTPNFRSPQGVMGLVTEDSARIELSTTASPLPPIGPIRLRTQQAARPLG